MKMPENQAKVNPYAAAVKAARKAREASRTLRRVPTVMKNRTLHILSELLQKHMKNIVTENGKDLKQARTSGLPQAHINRLIFDAPKIEARIRSLQKIQRLPDPVGRMEKMGVMENGITYGRMRVPLGVILMIYEARPHVTINAGAFALKSGNAIILKGGSEASHCLTLLSRLWKEALIQSGLIADAVQVVTLGHDEVMHLLSKPDLIDLVIPRGGKALIESVCKSSKIPVIKHFEGNCHVYIGRHAHREKALSIILDSKLLMPGVCNAAESLLIDRSMIDWLPDLAEALHHHEIEIRGCPEAIQRIDTLKPATEEDYGTEYLDTIYSLKVVDGVDEAIMHINNYGSGHTDTIVTEDYSDSQKFIKEVDSSVVLVNASTMFCDGESLGMGAEIGISTDKLHARGPMGLEELTSYKFVLWGEGQVMGE